MDVATWYAVALGGLITAFFLAYMLLSVLAIAQLFGKRIFQKYLSYRQIPRYLRGPGKTTWFHLLLLLTFLITNVIALSVGVDDVPEFARRSGLLSVVNLIPLFLGGQINAISSHCGIGLKTYTRIHRWLGRVAIVEGLIHVIVTISIRRPNFETRADVAALVAAVIILLILPSGLIRQRMYEIFLNVHLVFSVAIIFALYLHTPTNLLNSPTIYLLAAVCLQILTGCIKFGQILYRSVRYKRPSSRASVRTITFKRSSGREISLSDAVHVHVRLPRAWKHRAGQYVYLCMPGVSRMSFAQLHPFYVAWWYRDGDDDYAVFIIQKQRGFTERLFSHRGSEMDRAPGLSALIEGPYGRELDLGSYGTVLLFATGIGIAGQLPYVARLLEGYHDCDVKTRRIALFWQVESEVQTAWVADRMQELLKEDSGRILDIHIYVLGNFLSIESHRGDYVQRGERIDMTYRELDIEEVIDSEMKQRKGRTAISVCADDLTSDAIRRLVRNKVDDTISLKELDFSPGRGIAGAKGHPATA